MRGSGKGSSRELHQDLCADAGTHIPRSPQRFYGPGRMRKRFYEVGEDYIRRKRPFDDETISGLPADETAWATTRKRAEALFFWHRNYGLQRREPHPMGKDLDELRRAENAYHAQRYRDAGMEVPGCYLEGARAGTRVPAQVVGDKSREEP